MAFLAGLAALSSVGSSFGGGGPVAKSPTSGSGDIGGTVVGGLDFAGDAPASNPLVMLGVGAAVVLVTALVLKR